MSPAEFRYGEVNGPKTTQPVPRVARRKTESGESVRVSTVRFWSSHSSAEVMLRCPAETLPQRMYSCSESESEDD